MIIVEKRNCVVKTFDRVLESFVDQDVEVNELVFPVNFKNWLEPCQKLGHLGESILQNLLNHFLLVLVKRIVLDPGLWVKLQ